MIYNKNVQEALAAGYTLEQIKESAVGQYKEALDAGFDRSEARKSLQDVYGLTAGRTASDVDDSTWLASLMFQPADPEKQAKPAKGIWDSVLAGYENSTAGLLIRGETPDMQLSPDASFWEKVAYSGAQMVGDIPAMALGAAIGGASAGAAAAPTGPGAAVAAGLGAAAGAGFVPEYIRSALMRSYASGKSTTFGEFFDGVVQDFQAGVRGAAIGVTAQGAGKLAGPFISQAASKVAPVTSVTHAAITGTSTLALDAATLTAAGSAIEGKMPTAEEFALNAVVCGGFKLGTSYAAPGLKRQIEKQSQKWVNVNTDSYLHKFAEHFIYSGESPEAVRQRTITDPSLNERVKAINQPIAEAEAVRIENFYAPLNKTDLTARGLDTPEGISKRRTEEEIKAQPAIEPKNYTGQWLDSNRYEVTQRTRKETEKQHGVQVGDAGQLVAGVAVKRGGLYYNLNKMTDKDLATIINEYDAIPGARDELIQIDPNYINITGEVNKNAVVSLARKMFENPTARFRAFLKNKEHDLSAARRIFGIDFSNTKEAQLEQQTGQPQKIRVGASGLYKTYPGGRKVFLFGNKRLTEQLPEAKPETKYSEAVENVSSKLSIGEKSTTSWHEKLDNLVYHLSDAMQGLNLGARGGKLSEAYVAAQAALGSAGKALHIIDYGMINGKGEVVGESLKSIMKDFAVGQGDYKELAVYMAAKQAESLHSKGIQSAYNAEDIKSILSSQTNPRADFYAKIADRIIKYEHGLLTLAHEGGILSKAKYDNLMKQYKDSIPVEALAEAYEPILRGLTASKLDRLQLFLGFGDKESAYKVHIDPLESLVRQTFTITKAIDQNTAKRIACETYGLSGKVAKGGVKVPYFYMTKNGQVESRSAVVPKEVAQGINAMTIGQAKMYNVAMGTLGKVTNGFRIGTTGNPVFASTNFIRDQIVAWIQSPKDVNFVPFLSALRGGIEILKSTVGGKESMYTEWMRDGGAMSAMASLTRDYTQKAIKGLQTVPVKNCIAEPWKYRKDLMHALSPMSWIKGGWNGIQNMVEFSDQMTRVGVYMKAREAGYSGRESAVISRRSTVDFARAGATIQGINSIVAFLNARVQGAARVLETAHVDPVTFLSRTMQGIIIPSTLLALAKHDFINSHTDPNDPEYAIADELKEIPDWEKMAYWHIPISTLGSVIRIPKPQELGILAAFPESFVTWASQKDSKFAMSYLETLQDQGFISGLYDTLLPNVIPTPLVAPTEVITNYSFFTGQPIIPSHLSNVMPAMQYRPGTSTTARWISEQLIKTGLISLDSNGKLGSPLNIDHLIRGWTGTMGQTLVSGLDRILETTGAYDRPVRATKIEDLPFFKTFVMKYPKVGSDSILKFNEESSALQRQWNSILQGGKSADPHMRAMAQMVMQSSTFGNFTQIRKAMSMMTQTMNMIEWGNDDPESKMQQQDNITLQMIQLAREGRKLIKQMKEAFNASRQ